MSEDIQERLDRIERTVNWIYGVLLGMNVCVMFLIMRGCNGG